MAVPQNVLFLIKIFLDSAVSETCSTFSEESKDSMNLEDLLKPEQPDSDSFFSELFPDLIPPKQVEEPVKPVKQPSSKKNPLVIRKTPKEKRVLTSTPTVRVIKIETPEVVSLRKIKKF